MNLQKMARDIIDINDWRLEGKINREEHATMIATCDRIMAAHGWTWEDIERAQHEHTA